MRAIKGCASVAVVLGFAVLAAAGVAASEVKVQRCAYARIQAGRVALYPWQMSCAAARETFRQSNSRHDPTMNFTADGVYTFDAAAVKIAGQWWVCGGRMGYYFCGYPYRPARAHGVGGGTTYKGPFTKEFVFETCGDGSPSCTTQARTFQPPLSYP